MQKQINPSKIPGRSATPARSLKTSMTIVRLCSSRKYPYPPTEGQWKFRGGGGLKGGNFRGVRGCPYEEFLQRVKRNKRKIVSKAQSCHLIDTAEKFIVIIQKKSSATDESS